MSDNGKHTVIDTLNTKHNGTSPCTYSDYYVDGSSKKIPMEVALTSKDDYFSRECLDYIIKIIPNFEKDRKKTMNHVYFY